MFSHYHQTRLFVCFLGNVLLSDGENKPSAVSSVAFLFNRVMSSEFDNNHVDDNYSGDGDETQARRRMFPLHRHQVEFRGRRRPRVM